MQWIHIKHATHILVQMNLLNSLYTIFKSKEKSPLDFQGSERQVSDSNKMANRCTHWILQLIFHALGHTGSWRPFSNWNSFSTKCSRTILSRSYLVAFLPFFLDSSPTVSLDSIIHPDVCSYVTISEIHSYWHFCGDLSCTLKYR